MVLILKILSIFAFKYCWISVSVTVGATGPVTTTNSNITGHSLAIDAHETVTVKIEYASGGDTADGDFTVAFGDIALLYSSVD